MPGLAASPGIFERIALPDSFEIHWMHWIIPRKDEPLQEYVKRLIKEQIHHKNPILMGVSFGGIVVQEIAKQITYKKLILVSTIKSHHEYSDFLKIAIKYNLHKIFPTKALNYIDLIEKIAFTKPLKRKMKLYKQFLDVTDPLYFDWALKTVLAWKQEEPLENTIHIQGNKDKVFPIEKLQTPLIVVPNGRHDMIVFKAGWFNKHLPELLS